MFRLIYRAIFRLVFTVDCMYNCWCFESYEISYYKYRQMFQRVWQEIDYMIDIYRVTKGGHTEHL
jgi:hypothetical protein